MSEAELGNQKKIDAGSVIHTVKGNKNGSIVYYPVDSSGKPDLPSPEEQASFYTKSGGKTKPKYPLGVVVDIRK